MTKYETITLNELKKIFSVSDALDLELLCTITDTIIKFRIYGKWKVKYFECSQNEKRKIFELLNEHYKSRTSI